MMRYDLGSGSPMESLSRSLERFHVGQEYNYDDAIEELTAGCKLSHWIWYVFPQLKGLGVSTTSEYYGLDGIVEARMYFHDEVLHARLIEACQTLLENNLGENIMEVMGEIDSLKLRSSMTLFEQVAPECNIFAVVLDQFFGGERDELTLALLNRKPLDEVIPADIKSSDTAAEDEIVCEGMDEMARMGVSRNFYAGLRRL